ncbi:hypothetical protein RIF29_38834 [Crotalaria pallida]|uniref:Uncharacterized protein n=1 Tax=Crotalaria pallida TaxID=3830 RepID=A0AAN9E2J1_CROPI
MCPLPLNQPQKEFGQQGTRMGTNMAGVERIGVERSVATGAEHQSFGLEANVFYSPLGEKLLDQPISWVFTCSAGVTVVIASSLADGVN